MKAVGSSRAIIRLILVYAIFLNTFFLFVPPKNDLTMAYSDPFPKLIHLGTSSAFPNIIAVIHEASSVPWFSPTCGNCWFPFKSSPSSIKPSQIAVTPREDGSKRFLVTVDGEGVYRTGDTGYSWAFQAFPHPADCTEPDKFNLVVSSRNPRRLYLTRSCYYDDGFGSAAYYSVFTSPDSGLSWQLIRGGGMEVWVRLITSPSLADRVYVMNGAGVWYRSDNAGQTWLPQDYPIHILTVDSQNPDWLYGIYTHGVSGDVGKRSVDGGVTWSPWNEMPCPNSLDDKQLLAHPTQSNVLFLLCDQGMYRSLNGGDNWEQLSTTRGQFLAADNGRPGRLLWARDGGLWASEDAGSTWDSLVSSWSQLLSCLSVFLPSITR